jgi:hypothetical protein
VKQALWLKSKGKLEEAQEFLSRWSELEPNSELIATARADVYLAEDNPFWALKVLGEFASTHPKACDAKTLEARIQVQQANLEQAEALLNEPGCDAPEALQVRRLLLRAEIAELRGNGEKARLLVSEAEAHSSRYEEDNARLAQLEQAYDPYRLPLWTLNLDVAGGYVSTGMAQAPLDVSAPVPTQGSAIASLHLLGRVVVPYRPALRPVAEIEYSATQQLNDRPRELSVRQPSLRVGALFGRAYPRLQLNYAYELVDFDGDSNSQSSGKWYSVAHRGEYRLELAHGLLNYGSVGYREFSDDRLSRVESETGLLKNWSLSETLGVSLGGTLRGYRAEHHAFDQLGLSGFVGLRVQAPKEFVLQESLTLSQDWFPASERYLGARANERKDLRVNVAASLLSPEIFGLRIAATYNYVERDSNTSLYDFNDHRALLEVHYRLSHDQWRANTISAKGRIVMHHEREAPKSVDTEGHSVRDALQKDEELRRGSSCMR